MTSNSHKAIDNLLMAVAKRAREAAVELKAIKKIKWRGSQRSRDRGNNGQRGVSAPTRQWAAPPGCLLAPSTTSKRLSFADEAGQVVASQYRRHRYGSAISCWW